MPKDWSEKTDDELLNFDGSQPNLIAQYERIMAKKTIDALREVRAGLFDVKKSMHLATDKLDARLADVEKTQRDAATTQGKLQRVTVWLTVVIALSTVAYTLITWQSVQTQREANQIQRELRSRPSTAQRPSNPPVNTDARDAPAPASAIGTRAGYRER